METNTVYCEFEILLNGKNSLRMHKCKEESPILALEFESLKLDDDNETLLIHNNGNSMTLPIVPEVSRILDELYKQCLLSGIAELDSTSEDTMNYLVGYSFSFTLEQGSTRTTISMSEILEYPVTQTIGDSEDATRH